jgi:hypothetical protein
MSPNRRLECYGRAEPVMYVRSPHSSLEAVSHNPKFDIGADAAAVTVSGWKSFSEYFEKAFVLHTQHLISNIRIEVKVCPPYTLYSSTPFFSPVYAVF